MKAVRQISALVLVMLGLAHLVAVIVVGSIDTGSVYVSLAREDGIFASTIRRFSFTPWLTTDLLGVRPFSYDKSRNGPR